MSDLGIGKILKMHTQLDAQGLAHYQLPLDGQLLSMNPLVGKQIALKFSGEIYCIHTGKRIKKSFGQGFSYEAYMRLAQCDTCYMKPELCHFGQGTCREPEWGEKNCMIDTIVYVANTGEAKVGLTRHTQVPTRWIDQGAVEALAVAKLKTRKLAGEFENEIRRFLPDRTNWRKMLKNEIDHVDLSAIKEQIFHQCADILDDMEAEEEMAEVTKITYPVLRYPEKIISLDFEKTPSIEGTLIGIKGQYLIFDLGVINMRKYQGYRISISSR